VGIYLSDLTNTFRAVSVAFVDKVGLESTGYEVTPEISYKAWLYHARISTVNVAQRERNIWQSHRAYARAFAGYAKMLLKGFLMRITGKWIAMDW
jgi:hypothetical protein